jgi:hypothetical protein
MYLKRYHDIAISKSGVWRILKRLDMGRLPASQRYKRHDRRWKRYEKQLPGHRVQIDVKVHRAHRRGHRPPRRAEQVLPVHRDRRLHPAAGASDLSAALAIRRGSSGTPDLRALIDFDEPAAVLMVAILHLVADAEDSYGIVTAPGSYLALSHVTTDPRPQAKAEVTEVYRTATAPMVPRTRSQVQRFFTGFELVDPGVVYAPEWRPD